METGFRHTVTGEAIPRNIVTTFSCRYNGVEIFRADLFPAIAANPFLSFFTVATESGVLEFSWTGDRGFSETATASITVSSPTLAEDIAANARRSGYSFMAPQTRAMQDDDTANPGMLSVLDGEKLWRQKVGAANTSCADCHRRPDNAPRHRA
eukprot:gene4215-5748_t